MNWPSVRAILFGFIACVVLTTGCDLVLHAAKVYPAPGVPMADTALLLLALSYRMVFDGLGSYIAARLAPARPMWHALVLGAIGQVLALLGVAAGLSRDLGPIWYPVALAISVMPTAWIGGKLYRPRVQG